MIKKLLAKIYPHPYIFNLLVGGTIIVLAMVFFNDIEKPDDQGRTPLFLAAEQGNGQQLKRLLDRHAQVDARDKCQWTPLMRAAQNGHLDVVKRLLAAGADINAVDRDGTHALTATVINNQPAVFDYLVTQGIALDLQDKSVGWTALIWAVKLGHAEMVDTLLSHHADKSLRDHDGKSAYDWALEKNRLDMVQQLLP